MIATELPPTRKSPTDWILNWIETVPSALYRVYRDGQKLGQTTALSFPVYVGDQDQANFSIRDDDLPPPYDVPARATLWWQRAIGDPPTVYYNVDKFNGAGWDNVAQVSDDGSAAYKILTDVLENLVEHEWRIIAVDEDENESDPLVRTLYLVRRPDPTSWTYDYNEGTGDLTITPN